MARPGFRHSSGCRAYANNIYRRPILKNCILAIAGAACLAASVQAQSGRLFVGQYGFDPDLSQTCYEANLDPGFPGSLSWSPTFQFDVQGAACTPQNLIYLTSGTFNTDLYVTIPGRTPSVIGPTSQTIFDMGYVNGKLYGWAQYASPSGIYEIDPQTGACTLRVESTSELFFALDGNQVDGLLYGFSEYGQTGLYSINPTTGVKHRIAPPPPVAQFPNAYGYCRALAVGNNTVYLCSGWNGRDLSDPDHVPADTYYAYDLTQGDNGVYVAFTNPYANSTPLGGGAFWYDPSVVPVVPSPTNDLCANATPVGEGTFAFDTTWAGTDGFSVCGGVFDVWFLYTPTQTYYAQFSTCGATGFDSVVSIYNTGCGGFEIDCNDDSNSCPTQSTVGTAVTAGVPVLVRISGYDDAARGSGTLSIAPCPGITFNSQPVDATINRCTATLPSDFSQGSFFVRFTVDPVGRDDITYHWHRNGQPLFDQGPGTLEDYSVLNTHGWSMLIIRPTAADAGVYTCVVSSEECQTPISVESAPATLFFCTADFNCAGGVSVQDIFDFLNAYFSSGNLAADVNRSGEVTVQDIFDFLSAYFSGCP